MYTQAEVISTTIDELMSRLKWTQVTQQIKEMYNEIRRDFRKDHGHDATSLKLDGFILCTRGGRYGTEQAYFPKGDSPHVTKKSFKDILIDMVDKEGEQILETGKGLNVSIMYGVYAFDGYNDKMKGIEPERADGYEFDVEVISW